MTSTKEPMRPRQHDATKVEKRAGRHKLSPAEKKELERVRRIVDEQHWRRAHRKALTKARNASVDVFVEAKERLDEAAGNIGQRSTNWEEVYSAARAVGHQADKLAAVKEVIRIEAEMQKRGYKTYGPYIGNKEKS